MMEEFNNMLYPDDLVEMVKLAISDNLKNMNAIDEFVQMTDDELIVHHFGIGMYIRNHYKLWDNKQLKKYTKNVFPTPHPDDISYIWLIKARDLMKEDNETI